MRHLCVNHPTHHAGSGAGCPAPRGAGDERRTSTVRRKRGATKPFFCNGSIISVLLLHHLIRSLPSFTRRAPPQHNAAAYPFHVAPDHGLPRFSFTTVLLPHTSKPINNQNQGINVMFDKANDRQKI